MTSTSLTELHPNSLWTAAIPFKLGFFDLGARMTVVRLDAEGLLLISPVTLSEELRAEIDALGKVTAIVAPNNMHYLDLDEVARHYPEARRFALPGVVEKVESSVEELDIAAGAPWDDVLESHHFKGSAYLDEVTFFHSEGRTLIVTDLSFNLAPRNSFSGFLTKMILGMKTRFGPTRLLRASIRDREAGRTSIGRILEWDFDRVIVTHGDVVQAGGKEKFQTAWKWLLEK